MGAWSVVGEVGAAERSPKGALEEAERLYRRALAIKEARREPGHPDIAMSLNNLAVLYRTAGRLFEASDLSAHALRLFEEALGPDHPRTLGCRQNAERAARCLASP